jgi:hypothetical protein
MPMTINNSINVKPRILLGPRFAEVRFPTSDSGKDGHQELGQGETNPLYRFCQMLSGILYTFSFYFPADAVVCGADLEEMKYSGGNVPHLMQI